jgi:hypothetical protein
MRYFLLCFCFFIVSLAFSQKVLKLDTPKKPSKMSFLIGETITFRLEDTKENPVWYTERILDFDVDKGTIVFDKWQIHYQDITHVRNGRARQRARTTGAMLKTFGVGLIGFSTLGRLTKNCPNCNEALVAGAGSTLVGWLIQKISGPKSYKIGTKNKLRLLDLTPIPKKDIVRKYSTPSVYLRFLRIVHQIFSNNGNYCT